MKNKRMQRIVALLISVSVSFSQMGYAGAQELVTVSQNMLTETGEASVSENQMDDVSYEDEALAAWQAETKEADISDQSETDNQEGEVQAPEKMKTLSALRLTYQSNQITFDLMPNVVGYELYRGTKPDGSDRTLLSDIAQTTESQKSYTDSTGIIVGTTYYYWIRAYVMGSEFDEEKQAKKPVRVYGAFSDPASVLARLDQVTNVQAASESYQSNTVTWNAVGGADGYYVYYALAQTGPFFPAGQATGNLALSFTHKNTADGGGLVTGTTYYYKVSAYCRTTNGTVMSEDSAISSAITQLSAPQKLTASSKGYKILEIAFEKVDGANGYEIYRSTKSDKGFKKIATLKKGTKVTYLDKKCNTGQKYYYKVKAYRKTGGKTVYSEYSQRQVGVATLNKPKMKSTSLVTGDTVKLTWKKVNGAQGYQIYRSETKKGTYKKIQTIKGNVDTTQISGQENGKTFYYKVRAYRKVSAKNRYSAYSNVKSAVFNIFASANETYADKAQRIFGSNYYQKYASEAEAKAHMSTFAIQVWDLGADRTTKVTKTKMITVNANIAETVKQIFKEIYESDEKFPIKNVGGYSWRGDASTSEHCCGLAIDINWEENYMIDNGVIISGKYWKPGEDPYSIPLDCELVRIMEKYGFSRGIWGNRMDYMHFSYFGT